MLVRPADSEDWFRDLWTLSFFKLHFVWISIDQPRFQLLDLSLLVKVHQSFLPLLRGRCHGPRAIKSD